MFTAECFLLFLPACVLYYFILLLFVYYPTGSEFLTAASWIFIMVFFGLFYSFCHTYVICCKPPGFFCTAESPRIHNNNVIGVQSVTRVSKSSHMI